MTCPCNKLKSAVLKALFALFISHIAHGGETLTSAANSKAIPNPKPLSAAEEAYQNRDRIRIRDSLGALPIQEAFYYGQKDLFTEYAKLWPESLLLPSGNPSDPSIAQSLIDRWAYKQTTEDINLFITTFNIAPNMLSFPKESGLPISYFSKKDLIPKPEDVPGIEAFLRHHLDPKIRKSTPSPGGLLEPLIKMRDMLYLADNPIMENELQSKWAPYFNYVIALDLLSEAYPNLLTADQWNPKFVMILLETYLHTLRHYDRIANISLEVMHYSPLHSGSYNLKFNDNGQNIFFFHYNNFMSRLLIVIEKKIHPTPITNFETPNLLHAIEWQIIKAQRDYLDSNTDLSDKKSRIAIKDLLIDLRDQLSKSEAFKGLSDEIQNRPSSPKDYETLANEFQQLSDQYIRQLAGYKIDYRSAKD